MIQPFRYHSSDLSQYRRLVGSIMASLMIVLLISSPTAMAQSTVGAQPSTGMRWIELWRHETIEPVQSAAIGDPVGNGVLHLAALIGRSVYVYELASDGPRFVDVLRSIPERPTAVAMAPYQPGAPASLWIGTEAPGIIYVYSIDEITGTFKQVQRIRFSWGDIQRILPLDLDGQGFIDVAVLTDRNEAMLFRWTPDGYVDVLPGEFSRNVRFIDKGSISESERDDLLVARDLDQVVLLSWMPDEPLEASGGEDQVEDIDGRLITMWENYVWGTPMSVLIDYFSGLSAPDVAVVSSRRLVHLYSRQGGSELLPRTNPMEWPAVGGALMGSGRFTASARAVVAVADGDELTFWELFPSVRPYSTLRTPINPITGVLGGVNEGHLVIVGPSGFSLQEWMPSDYVRVLKNGQPIQLQRPPLLIDDTPFLSASDWMAMTGVNIRYDRETGRITGSRGLRFIFGRVGEADWLMNGLQRKTWLPAVQHDDEVYLDPGFGSVIGVYTVWEPFSRTMLIDP